MAQHGEILRSIVHTVSGPIFLHDNIKAPVEAIFHTPVRPGDRIEALGRERLAEQVVGGFAGGLIGGLADPGDLCDRLQAWPLMLFLQPIDMGRDDGGAGFNAA